jgi:hypothetical protein
MNKLSISSFAILLVLGLLVAGCTLSASDAPAPTALSTAVLSAATGTPAGEPAAAPEAEATDTGILPTATPLPAVTDTPAAPAAEPIATQPPAPTATPLPAASRVLFSSGDTTTVNGELNAGQTLYYVVQGAAGQALQVDTWSPNGDVYLGITSATSGETLLNAALQDANWTGTLPAAQDYYLSITAGGAQTSYAVTVELTPLPAAAATATTGAPPVSGLFNPVTAYGEADFEDPMTGSAISDWEDDDGDLPDTLYLRLTLDDARFYVTGKLAGFSTWYFTWRELSDFYLQATMDSGSCSGQDAYGLIVRGPEHMAGVSYGYVVAFTCDGKLWVYRLDGADPFTATDLVSLTPSQYINAGANQRNLIGIQAIGDTLTIYANGHQIAQVTDSRYEFGRFGVFVCPQWTSFYTYRVVNLSYWDLED